MSGCGCIETPRWTGGEKNQYPEITGTEKAKPAVLCAHCISGSREEGLETVIFFIGLVGKLSLTELIGGTAAGLVVLVIVGVLMMKLGMRIPLKPFFLLSMAVVLYMCVKFLGTGVHSLQLAGILPSDAESWLPSVSVLGIYPSVYSTIPQLLILLFLLIALISEAAKHYTNGKELTK